MKILKIFLIFQFSMISMLSYAQIEIPEKLIINKNDLYLKGEVKTLKLWSTQKNSSFKYDEAQLNFLPNGTLLQIDASMGLLGQEWEFDKKTSKLIKHHVYMNAQNKDRANYLIGTVTKYDEKNRPQIIAYYPQIAPNILSKKTLIEYTHNTETYKQYANMPDGKLQLMTIQTVKLNQGTNQLETITLTNAPPYHFMPPLEKIYENNGMTISTLKDMRENSKIEYKYNNNVLAKIINYSNHDTDVNYINYKFDACENWIQRSIFDTKNNEYGTEYRKIEYYTPCIIKLKF
ncbi:hypothetical protein [Acinetobacter modestus]|uniref:hypothetical protein n=1 Tax=Acinetobacter modestus TaxID=1776740 RepID=UPI00320B1678